MNHCKDPYYESKRFFLSYLYIVAATNMAESGKELPQGDEVG